MNVSSEDTVESSKKEKYTTYALILAVIAILLFFFFPRKEGNQVVTSGKDFIGISEFSIHWVDFGGGCVDSLPDITLDICIINRGTGDVIGSTFEILFQTGASELVTFDPPSEAIFPSLSPGEQQCQSITLPLSQLGPFSEMVEIGPEMEALNSEAEVYAILFPASGQESVGKTRVVIGGQFLTKDTLNEGIQYSSQLLRMLPDVMFTAFDSLEPLPVCVDSSN